MAYVPETNEIGLSVKKLKKGLKKLGKAVRKAALPLAATTLTGGAALPAVSAINVKKAVVSSAIKGLKKVGKKSKIKTTQTEPQTTTLPQADDKIFGLDKKVVIYGGVGVGALLLILMVSKK